MKRKGIAIKNTIDGVDVGDDDKWCLRVFVEDGYGLMVYVCDKMEHCGQSQTISLGLI